MGEISHHPLRHPLSAVEAREELRKGLECLGILRREQPVAAETVRNIRYGHVIYNHKTRESVRMVSDYLRSHSIFVCGKYGARKDMLIPESIRSGIAVARKIMASRLSTTSRSASAAVSLF